MESLMRFALALALAVAAVPALADHGATATGMDDPAYGIAEDEMEGFATESAAGYSTRPQLEGSTVAASYDAPTAAPQRTLGDDPLDRAMDFGGE
jgi:hypothetical protein